MGPGDELVDIVDPNDEVIDVVTRAEMRTQNLLHRCAEIAIRNTAGELWIHRRTETKDVYPGMYDMVVGGVLASGESWKAGARRELAEETSIEGVELREVARHLYEGPQERAMMRLYEVVWDGPILPQPEEIAWGKFVSVSQLERMLRTERFCPDSVAIFDRWRDGRLDP